MKRSFSIIVYSLLFLFAACSDDTVNSPLMEQPPDETLSQSTEYAVILNDYAAIRFQPQYNTTRIDALPKGTRVEVIEHSKSRSRIGGVSDYWYRVRLPSGLIGWTYGSNIKRISDDDDFSIEEYQAQFEEEAVEEIIEQLKGKWWSVTSTGRFTSHMLMLYPDYTYLSERGGFSQEGEYTLDMQHNTVSFSDGTSFGDTIRFQIRGQDLLLEADIEEQAVRFVRISRETDTETEERLEGYRIEDLEELQETDDSEP